MTLNGIAWITPTKMQFIIQIRYLQTMSSMINSIVCL